MEAHPPLDRLGLSIGHYSDPDARTGLTAFIAADGATIGVDIPSGYSGTFQTPGFALDAALDAAYAVVLTGGSTYGMASIHGVMQYLEQHGIGRRIGDILLPDATGAVIWDLNNGRADVRPTVQNGYDAAANARNDGVEVGRVGVGTGATTGKWYRGRVRRGGFAVATVELPHHMVVSAFAVTNALGDIGADGTQNLPGPDDDLRSLRSSMQPATTHAVVATNVSLTKAQLTRVAKMATHGLVRSMFPATMASDGDVVFALSSLTGERLVFDDIDALTLVDTVGIGAAEAVRQACLSTVSRTEVEHA
jgi:L-aminopeptidase/D-esterase-like protein